MVLRIGLRYKGSNTHGLPRNLLPKLISSEKKKKCNKLNRFQSHKAPLRTFLQKHTHLVESLYDTKEALGICLEPQKPKRWYKQKQKNWKFKVMTLHRKYDASSVCMKYCPKLPFTYVKERTHNITPVGLQLSLKLRFSHLCLCIVGLKVWITTNS